MRRKFPAGPSITNQALYRALSVMYMCLQWVQSTLFDQYVSWARNSRTEKRRKLKVDETVAYDVYHARFSLFIEIPSSTSTGQGASIN